MSLLELIQSDQIITDQFPDTQARANPLAKNTLNKLIGYKNDSTRTEDAVDPL